MNTKSLKEIIKRESQILIMQSAAFWCYYTLLVLLDLAVFIGIPFCVPRIGVFILFFGIFRIYTVPINYILSLFRNYRYEPSAPKEIREKDAPQLFSIIREIAAKTGNMMPKRVYLTPEFGAHVNFNYDFQLGFVNNIEYELTIGIRLLREMNVSEMRSILAHELGHFSKRNAITAAHINWLDTTYERMQHTPQYNNILSKFLPLFYYPLAFIFVRPLTSVFYKHISVRAQWLNRYHELYSDTVACEITGSKPVVSSLCKLDIPTNSFDVYTQMLVALLQEGYSVRDFLKGYAYVDEQTAEDVSMNISFQDTLTEPVGDSAIYPSRLPVLLAWDVHPSLQERIDHVNSLPVGEGEVNKEVASSLVKEEALSDWGKTFQYYLKIEQGKSKEWKPQVMEHKEFVAWATKYLAEHRTPHFLLPFMEKHIEKFQLPDDRTTKLEEVENPFTEENRNLILEYATAYADMEKLKMIKSGSLHVLEFTYCGVSYTDPAYPMSEQERYLSTLQRKWEELDVKLYKYLWEKTSDTMLLKDLYWMMGYAEDTSLQITNMPLKAGRGDFVYYHKIDEETGNMKMVFTSWKMRRALKKGIMELLQNLEYDRMESLSKKSWYSYGEAARQILRKCKDIAMNKKRLRSDEDVILLTGELQSLFQSMHNNALEEWHRIVIAAAEGGPAQTQSRVQSGRANKRTPETETSKATNEKTPSSPISQTKDDLDEDMTRAEDSYMMDTQVGNPSTRVTEKDLSSAIKDKFGVLYSYDRKRLLACRRRKWNLLQKFMRQYSVKQGTEVICDEAFVDHGGCERLEEVRLPDSVKAIGKHAFRGCSRLKTMSIGSNVTTIGDYAFSGCKGLTELNFNATACPSVGLNKNIIVPIFEGCAYMTKASIGDNVTVVPPHLFYNCTSLREVRIGRNVREIGSEAFLDCINLKRINIPASVTEIGGGAFDGCLELVEIEVAKENEHYCSVDGVLYSKDMSVLLRFPSGSPLKEFSVPESVKDIGDLAFSSCANLRKVTLPCGLESIGEDCFLGSKKIKLQVTCPPNGIKTSLKARFEDMLSGQDVDTVKVL